MYDYEDSMFKIVSGLRLDAVTTVLASKTPTALVGASLLLALYQRLPFSRRHENGSNIP